MPKQERQFKFSLNNPVGTENGDRREHLDLLASSEDLCKNCYLNELRERFQEIINSPQWQSEHPRNRPEFNLAAFLYYKYQGLSYKAIATELGVSPAYAASHWQRKFQPILCELLQDFQ
ncbi:MAG: hypothetical protein WBB82_14205 [Limnothrix sp.]